MAGGRVKRGLQWYPKWYPAEHNTAGIRLEDEIPCQDWEAIRDIMLTRPLPSACTVRITPVRTPQKLILACSFSHLLFDGIGAEEFLRKAAGNGDFHLAELQYPTTDWQTIRQAGVKMGNYMKEINQKSICRIPTPRKETAVRYHILRISAEKLTLLQKKIDQKYGPFSFSIWLLALLLQGMEKQFRKQELPGEYIMIPMSVDLRNKRGLNGSIFFNQWSLMPLTVPRTVLQRTLTETVQSLRALYMTALAERVPEMFRDAAEAMRYIPYFGIDPVVRRHPGQTLGTMMFSYLNSNVSDIFNAQNFYHCPVMPAGCPLGFFVNNCNGLNLTISERGIFRSDDYTQFVNLFNRTLEEELQ